MGRATRSRMERPSSMPDVVNVEADCDRAVRPQDLEAGLVAAGQVAERVASAPAGVPADGVDAVAVVVGGRELIVCDRDVARSAPASVTPEEVSGRARQAYRACWCCRRRKACVA